MKEISFDWRVPQASWDHDPNRLLADIEATAETIRSSKTTFGMCIIGPPLQGEVHEADATGVP